MSKIQLKKLAEDPAVFEGFDPRGPSDNSVTSPPAYRESARGR